MSELTEMWNAWRSAAILLAIAIVLALAVAVILNLRYKELGAGGPPMIAYIDTWTGTPTVCQPVVPFQAVLTEPRQKTELECYRYRR